MNNHASLGVAKGFALDSLDDESKSDHVLPPQGKEAETVNKMQALFCEIRNTGVFEYGKKELDRSNRIFWPMFQSEMEACNSGKPSDQKFILNYLMASELKRKQLIEKLSFEQLKKVIFEADLWQISDLVNRCDQILARRVVFTKEELNSLSKLNLLSFPLLNAWLFLFGVLSLDPEESSRETIENARQWIDFKKREVKALDLSKLDLEFLEKVDPIYAPRVAFTVNQFFINNENIEKIFTIAKSFHSHPVMHACLQYEAPSGSIKKSIGNELLINMQTAYKIGEIFKPAPCESNGTAFFLDSEKLDPKRVGREEVITGLRELLSLLLKYSELSLGLSLRLDLVSQFARLVEDRALPSLKLLHFIPVNGEPSFKGEEVQSIFRSFPNLETVVIPESVKDFFPNLPPNLTYWKNLCGRVKRVQCGTKRSQFDEIWKKFPDPYRPGELPIKQ